VLLVIACPCALVISTPVSIVSGLTGVSFGEIKGRAFSILERDKIKRAADFMGAHSIDVTAFEWEFVDPFSKRGFEQTFPILFFKKCEKRERQADACLSGCYNA
jgi:hypothetical protein